MDHVDLLWLNDMWSRPDEPKHMNSINWPAVSTWEAILGWGQPMERKGGSEISRTTNTAILYQLASAFTIVIFLGVYNVTGESWTLQNDFSFP